MKAPHDSALGLIDELVSLLDSLGAAPNPPALARFQRLGSELGLSDAYITQRTTTISTRAGQYLSARGWANHRQGHEGVRRELLAQLTRLREHIEHLRGLGDGE